MESAAWTTAMRPDRAVDVMKPVITMSGTMMIWNGTKAQTNRMNRKLFAHFTFHSASA